MGTEKDTHIMSLESTLKSMWVYKSMVKKNDPHKKDRQSWRAGAVKRYALMMTNFIKIQFVTHSEAFPTFQLSG